MHNAIHGRIVQTIMMTIYSEYWSRRTSCSAVAGPDSALLNRRNWSVEAEAAECL